MDSMTRRNVKINHFNDNTRISRFGSFLGKFTDSVSTVVPLRRWKAWKAGILEDSSANVMVPLLTRRQELSAPDDGGENSDWGPMQIATPIIIGVGLIIVFAAFILWQRRSPNKLAYHYHQARNAWVARAERIFLPRRVRHRVLHSSDPVTLDDSILTPNFTLDFRRVRQHRSDSSDSQTALTTSTYSFDYPPKPPFSKSPSPSPERRPWRWWRFLKSKPEEITSEEPGLRWRIDGPDGSSTGHGHSILDPEERNRSRYISGLEVVNEELETAEDSVIRIGNNFSSIESTPLTQYFHEERFRLVPPSPAASTAPVYPVGPRTPGPTPTCLAENSYAATIYRGHPPPSTHRPIHALSRTGSRGRIQNSSYVSRPSAVVRELPNSPIANDSSIHVLASNAS
ncbi:hypothetical protein BS17DRAFT_764416 [Gyrodon lividus]|nr:hypothetical protein BS17DRAFT_764416 [Gyrodon lividus]